MANAMYDNIRNLALGGSGAAHTMPDMDSDTLRAQLLDAGSYTPNTASHQDEADLAGIITNGEATLSTVTVGSVGAGVVDCADIAWTSVSGSSAEYIVILQDTGTSSTSPLICIFDTATGLPLTPTGGNVTGVVNASGLFRF